MSNLLHVHFSVAVVDRKSRNVSLLVTNNLLLRCAGDLMLLASVVCLNHILQSQRGHQDGSQLATSQQQQLVQQDMQIL